MLCLLSRYIPRASSRETALSALLSSSLLASPHTERASSWSWSSSSSPVVAVSRPVAAGRGCSRCVYPGSGTLSPDETTIRNNVNDNDDDDDDAHNGDGVSDGVTVDGN